MPSSTRSLAPVGDTRGPAGRSRGGCKHLLAGISVCGAPNTRDLVDLAMRLIAERSDGETHTVAAAVLTADGLVAEGLNLLHFTGGPYAELTALAAAAAIISAPAELIVAVGDGGRGVIPPCGRCRPDLARPTSALPDGC